MASKGRAKQRKARAAGGRLVFFYMTMGQYDVGAIVDPALTTTLP